MTPTPRDGLPAAMDADTEADGTAATAATSAVEVARSLVSFSRSTSGSVASAREAIEAGEAGRLRIYTGTMFLWCMAGLGIVGMLPGRWTSKEICWAALVFLTFTYAWMWWRARSAETLAATNLLPIALLQACGAIAINYGMGIFSPFPAIIAIGLTLFCLSAPASHATAVCVVLTVGYGITGTLVLTDAIPDQGLIATTDASFSAQLASFIGVELAMFTAFAVGQLASRDNANVVKDFERAVRDASRRDVLLAEAREELERAAGIGDAGRFTDQEIGSFKLGVVIGRGGMGEVYEAVHMQTAAEAAVKLMRRDVLGDRALVSRFEREARIVAGLASPRVVEVLEVGGMEAPLPFIAMERLRGVDLATRLRDEEQLKIGDVVELCEQVCEGLAAAHAARIVHRDMKPHNLFQAITAPAHRGWKLLDFGVSKLLDASENTLTAGHLVGTPSYMAPEQATRRTEVDHRADLYSLSVILYRALTGEPAFAKGDMASVVDAITHDMPRDPCSLRKLEPDLGLALRIGLAKDPSSRYESAEEMAAAFGLAAKGKLGAAYRTHARRLITARPWGSTKAHRKADPEDTMQW